MKHKKGIYTLADIQQRKREIAEELECCEESILESYYNFTHPSSLLGRFLGCESAEEEAPQADNVIGNIASKAKTVISVVGTALSVYNLIKQFRNR